MYKYAIRCIVLIVASLLLGAYFNYRSMLIKKFSDWKGSGTRAKNILLQTLTPEEDREAETGVGAGGYVMGWDFREGQTCASRNLLGMVHWASDLNLTVVEPCVYGSFFNLANCVDALNQPSNKVRPLLFRDYFDIDYWNNQTTSHKIGPPLLAWKKFIKNIPEKVIIVYTWRLRTGNATVYIDDKIQKDAAGCYDYLNDKIASIRPQFNKTLFSMPGIKVIREVCFKYNSFRAMDVQWFNRQILGDHEPSDVLIVFAQWTGAFRGTIYLNKPQYQHMQSFDYIKPSPRVVEHSRQYAQQFLGGENYVAVHLRVWKIAITLSSSKHKSRENILKFFDETCSLEISKALQKLKNKRFLALDLGRFGDHAPLSDALTNDSMHKIITTLLSKVYGNVWNQTQWEDSFVQATGGITDSGYIAMMQKELVTNAACIVVGGVGKFQESLVKMFNQKTKDPCIHRVCNI